MPAQDHAHPLRFGILGAAAIARLSLVDPARAEPRATVAAVAAREPARAFRFADDHGIPRVHATYKELVADPDIDAVYIPLPNGLHGTWTTRSIEAGKHVLCEKPFAANADEARAVAEVADAHDRVVMEAFHWRYHPMAQRLLDIIAGGEIGRLRHVDAAVCFPLPRWSDIRYDLGLAGGALMDAGCYAVHMARTLVGEEPGVEWARAQLHGAGVDRALTGRLRFPGGVSANVTGSMWSRRLLAIRVKAYGDWGKVVAFNPLRPKLFGSIRVTVEGRRRREVPPRTSTYAHQLTAFCAAALDGRPFPTTVGDAVANMAVIDALYEAAGLAPRQPTPVA